MTTFVLVPGAWLGAWAWQEVTPALREFGHTALPLSLTGLAERADAAGPEVNLDTHIADVTSVLDDGDLRDVVLVGHSYAGIVVTGAADRRPDRVARVVYVDSGPAPDGVSSSEFAPPEAARTDRARRSRVTATVGGWRRPSSTPTTDPVNLAGLDDDALETLRDLATDHPYATMTQPLSLTGAGDRVPRTAICCTFPLDAVRASGRGGQPVLRRPA